MANLLLDFAHRLYGDQRRRLLSWLTRRVLGPHGAGILVEANGGYFAIDSADAEIGLRLRFAGGFALEEISRLTPFLGQEGRALVVGAHIGLLAIPLAHKCSQVVAIEANPRTFHLLTLNARLNGASNLRLHQFAANDRQGEMDFLLSTENSGGSKRVPKVRQSMYYYDEPEICTVRAAVLDEELGDEDFDVIVMDIEGSEYFALGGMQRLLSFCRVLSIEFLPHHLRNVAGVGVDEFLARIAPHFDRLTVPSRNVTVSMDDAGTVLRQMFQREEGDEALLFEKVRRRTLAGGLSSPIREA